MRSAHLPALLACLGLALTACSGTGQGAGAGGTTGGEAASSSASSGTSDGAWVSAAQRAAVADALERGTGASVTTLDVFSPAEYADAMHRQLDTVFADDVAGAGGTEQGSAACVAANRSATQDEADSGARAVAGAGNTGGARATATDGYVNLTVTDFPTTEAARRSWDLDRAVREACAGQAGWLGILDAHDAGWDGGEAVVYGERVTGPDGAATTMETTHVLDGTRQYVLNRRTDDVPADRPAGLAVLHDVAAALPPA